MKEIKLKEVICHDCKKQLKEDDECVPYQIKHKTFIKCKACYELDHTLRNYQETEVYSRVVGYIRPINQWNKGKAAEYKDRKVFKINI